MTAHTKAYEAKIRRNLAPYIEIEELRSRVNRRAYMRVRCTACGRVSEKCMTDVAGGRSVGCFCHGSPQRRPNETDPGKRKIILRYVIIRQTCTPGNKHYERSKWVCKENHFKDGEHFLETVLKECPSDNYEMATVQRINDYLPWAPGNICLSSRWKNAFDSGQIVMVDYEGHSMPHTHVWHVIKHKCPTFSFSQQWVREKLTQFWTVPELIEESRRSNYGRSQSAKPNPKIVALYFKNDEKEVSCTQ